MRKNLERFSRWMKLQHYSPTTIKEYNRELSKFFDFIEAENLDFDELQLVDIEDYVFSKDVNERTKNRTLSSIKSFFNYLHSRGIVTRNPAKDVKSIKLRRKNPVFLHEEEYHLLMQTINEQANGFVGLRDKMIVSLLLGTGMRVSEITSMQLGCETKDRMGKYSLEVMRKGQEMDYVYINQKISLLFDDYLHERRKISADSDFIFLTYRKKPMDRTAVYRMVKKYLEMCGLDKKKMGPHVLRHTFATALMSKDVSLYKIKELMNHKSLSTTQNYLHVMEQDLKDVVEKIDF
ncbi:MAG: tyrosine-type recombinase/integrase [Thermotogota bacterium]